MSQFRCAHCDVPLRHDGNSSEQSPLDCCKRCATEILWEPTTARPEPLPVNPLPRLICAWCQKVLRDGPVPASHGCCHDCAARIVTAPMGRAYWRVPGCRVH